MMSYSPTQGYLPPPNYYPHLSPPPQVTPLQSRQETTQQRKRPKYTRSKTGCLTCRVKKIKCDETKPNCMRCTHGQRDCTWPDGAPTRKKSSVRKDSLDADGRPSTAGSSISEGSTPPTRHPTPPRIQPLELDLPPLASRRMPSSEVYLPLHPSPQLDHSSLRRHSGDRFAYTHPPGPSHLSSLPETDPYISQHRYDHPYIAHPSTRPIAGPGMRSGAEHVPHPVQWHVPVLAPAHVDTYYSSGARMVVPNHSHEQLDHRYQ